MTDKTDITVIKLIYKLQMIFMVVECQHALQTLAERRLSLLETICLAANEIKEIDSRLQFSGENKNGNFRSNMARN